MDRRTFKLPFTRKRVPDWDCPSCNKGLLRIDGESFRVEEQAASRDHSDYAWEPDWVEYTYSCLLRCTNDKCLEAVSNVGRGTVDWEHGEDEDGHQFQDWDDRFLPLYFNPPLRLINIPSSCPVDVSEPLEESFRLAFASPGAAANAIRTAIEQVLTDLKIKRFVSTKGKRRYLGLHERIGLLPAKHAELKDLMYAINWLGNAGSHAQRNIILDDVFDAYELTEHVLQEIYAAKRKKLRKIARSVNQRRGPAK